MWNYSITRDEINEYVIKDKIFYKLIAINLMYTGLSDALIPPIADALRNQACAVRILHLGYNPQLTSTGVSEIARAVETNSSLVNLEFQQNAIGDSGAKAIADMLQINTTLVCLGLNGRHFPSDKLDITT